LLFAASVESHESYEHPVETTMEEGSESLQKRLGPLELKDFFEVFGRRSA
jgi:hypothetical protein